MARRARNKPFRTPAVGGPPDSLALMKLNKTLCVLAAALASATLTSHSIMAQSGPEQGQTYLAENAKKEGVKTTASGLQYKVLQEGTGKSPKATDTVLVHYRGTLLNGKEFDSSYKRNEPIEFPLNGVIAGWTEGVQLMKEGAKYQFVIPSNLAYGRRGTPGGPGRDADLRGRVADGALVPALRGASSRRVGEGGSFLRREEADPQGGAGLASHGRLCAGEGLRCRGNLFSGE